MNRGQVRTRFFRRAASLQIVQAAGLALPVKLQRRPFEKLPHRIGLTVRQRRGVQTVKVKILRDISNSSRLAGPELKIKVVAHFKKFAELTNLADQRRSYGVCAKGGPQLPLHQLI